VAPLPGLAIGIGGELVTVVSILLTCNELPPAEDCDRGGLVPGLLGFGVCLGIAHFTAVSNILICDGLLRAEDGDTGGLGGEQLRLPELCPPVGVVGGGLVAGHAGAAHNIELVWGGLGCMLVAGPVRHLLLHVRV
jgi:hypothetical protein